MKIPQTVFELQSRHDFVTDRQTDNQGKNNMSPNPTGGDIMTQTEARGNQQDTTQPLYKTIQIPC